MTHTLSNEFEILAPSNTEVSLEQVISQPSFIPFASELVEFTSELSRDILFDQELCKNPEYVAIGHWLRRAHILQLRSQFEKYAENRLLLARGTVFHIAPSNVDSIFIYSWILSLLAGNKNIIRISQNTKSRASILIERINNTLQKYPSMATRTLLVTYTHNKDVNQQFSEICDCRVIWGGDQTVQAIRSIPISPHATEIIFPDKFSHAVFRSAAFLASSHNQRTLIYQNFIKDFLWHHQTTCSSPKTLIWLGNEQENHDAQTEFWKALENLLQAKKELLEEMRLRQLTLTFSLAANEGIEKFESSLDSYIHRYTINHLDQKLRELHVGLGVFLEMQIQSLDELISVFNSKDQTIGSFGISKNEWMIFASKLPHRAIDRIVSIGRMLEFSLIWDGYNLLIYFTRELSIFENE